MQWWYGEEERPIELSIYFWLPCKNEWSEDMTFEVFDRSDFDLDIANISKMQYQLMCDWAREHMDIYNGHGDDVYFGCMDDYYGVARLECEDI